MGRSSTPPTSDAGLAYLASPPHAALLPPLDHKSRPLPLHQRHSPPSYSLAPSVEKTALPPLSDTLPDSRPELPPIQLATHSNGSVVDQPLPPISTVTAASNSPDFSESDARDTTPFTTIQARSQQPHHTPQQTPQQTPHQTPQQIPQIPQIPQGSTQETQNWPSLNPLTAYYTPGHAQTAESPLRMDIDSSSASPDARSTTSPDRHLEGRAGSVSLDDPDVRLAAEALGDLRADFVSSPPSRPSRLPGTSSSSSSTSGSAEPILSLLTTSHPLLAKTIENTTSAYNNSKNFSPRFKSGAEYVEGYLTPIGNTLGSVGRATGVEGGVRWFLNSRRRRQATSRDMDAGDPKAHKRRRMDLRKGRQSGSAADSPSLAAMSKAGLVERHDTPSETDERRFSMSTVDSLPAYDDLRSPAYTESPDTSVPDGTPANNNNTSGPRGAASRLIMSTSGLSIAMSDESLRSLKYCLNWLRWANDHMGGAIGALKTALDQFEEANAERTRQAENRDASQDGQQPQLEQDAQGNQQQQQQQQPGVAASSAEDLHNTERIELAARITALRGDVLRTLRGVIDTVSKYGGGALPDNARVLVHRHLMSLPQRFRLANQQGPMSQHPSTDEEVREGAQRVLVLAKEGLDMMAQVSGVLDGTIVSAEEWCEKLGKKKPQASAASGGDSFSLPAPATEASAGSGVSAVPAVSAVSAGPAPDRASVDVVMQE